MQVGCVALWAIGRPTIKLAANPTALVSYSFDSLDFNPTYYPGSYPASNVATEYIHDVDGIPGHLESKYVNYSKVPKENVGWYQNSQI